MDGHSLLFFLLANVIIFSVKSDNVTFKNVTVSDDFDLFIIIEESNSLKEHLPDKYPGDLFVGGEIPVLYKDSVADIEAVYGLEFVGNNMTKIEPGAFKNWQSVTRLAVNHNNLTTIESGVFENLTVHSLEVGHNHIRTISKGAFKNLSELYVLRLSYNKIETLEEGVFDNLRNLILLDLSNNEINFLPDRFFRNFPKLSMCSLETNKLGELRREIFENSQITHIDLSNNSISTLRGDFFTLPKLEIIVLNHNNLKTIPKGIFNERNLERIVIRFNEISFIDPEAFDNMPLLELINLENNKLNKYDPRWFHHTPSISRIFHPRWFHHTPSISRIFLESNQIQEIPDEAFKNIYNNKSQSINLSYNNIHTIAPQAFKGFKKIHFLQLSNNKINRWDDKLLADAETVGSLNLQNNKIVCPEGDFDKIFKAQVTFLADNELSEDCVKRIKEWVISHRKNEVDVDGNLVPIY